MLVLAVPLMADQRCDLRQLVDEGDEHVVDREHPDEAALFIDDRSTADPGIPNAFERGAEIIVVALVLHPLVALVGYATGARRTAR